MNTADDYVPSSAMHMQAEGNNRMSNLSFSEALDMYLEMREKGPEEGWGYTDKRYYNDMAALRRRMDQLAPKEDDEL